MYRDLYLFISIWASLFCNILSAQKVVFESNIDSAFLKAKQENKILFLDYYSQTCHICQAISIHFANPAVANFYNPNFINYKLNVDQITDEEQNFINQAGLKPPGVPVFFFFDGNKKLVHFAVPPPEVKAIVDIGHTALDSNMRVENVERKYKSGNRSINTLVAYSAYLQLLKKDSMVGLIADEIFLQFPKNQLNTKKSYLTMRSNVNSIENGFYKYWLEHRDSMVNFEEGKYQGREKEALKNIMTKSLSSKEAKNWDLKKLREVKSQMVAIDYSPNPDMFLWETEVKLLLEESKVDEAISICEKLLTREKSSIKGDVYILETLLDFPKNEKLYLQISKWIDDELAKPGCKAPEMCNLNYLKSKCLYDLNEKTDAKFFIERAVNCAKGTDTDVNKYKELIWKLNF
ncbi:MAG TPA: DUF255 domain-containing protein [Saprospiraceae bacterium]|nr:DUF255 domain-containing protein [Saprospiraceae bacterium]